MFAPVFVVCLSWVESMSENVSGTEQSKDSPGSRRRVYGLIGGGFAILFAVLSLREAAFEGYRWFTSGGAATRLTSFMVLAVISAAVAQADPKGTLSRVARGFVLLVVLWAIAHKALLAQDPWFG